MSLFFFKQKTAYEMRISDWSSDVCSSDLTFDLMLHLIRSRFGYPLALEVASVFVYDEAHAATDAQPLVSLGRLAGYEPRVAAAIRLMESRLDSPLTTAAIARRLEISVRKIGRASCRERVCQYV